MIKVLFVCFANICRSPAFQAIFEQLVAKESLKDKITSDSCSLSPHYSGKDIDPRMNKALQKKGYDFIHKSRLLKDSDFDEFDYILPVTKDMVSELTAMATSNEQKEKIILISDFSPNFKGQNIQDPYSMTQNGFEIVVDVIEDISCAFLEHLKSNDLKK